MPQPTFSFHHPTRAPMITVGQAFSILRTVHTAVYALSHDTGEADELGVFYAQRREDADGEVCELCGEPADDEMGEFWNWQTKESVIAHAQCGLDAGFPLA